MASRQGERRARFDHGARPAKQARRARLPVNRDSAKAPSGVEGIGGQAAQVLREAGLSISDGAGRLALDAYQQAQQRLPKPTVALKRALSEIDRARDELAAARGGWAFVEAIVRARLTVLEQLRAVREEHVLIAYSLDTADLALKRLEVAVRPHSARDSDFDRPPSADLIGLIELEAAIETVRQLLAAKGWTGKAGPKFDLSTASIFLTLELHGVEENVPAIAAALLTASGEKKDGWASLVKALKKAHERYRSRLDAAKDRLKEYKRKRSE